MSKKELQSLKIRINDIVEYIKEQEICHTKIHDCIKEDHHAGCNSYVVRQSVLQPMA